MLARDKSHDYGVDLEVEIFSTDTTATGLVFNVQIKATDDLSRSQSLRLTRAQRNYLRALPIPSILARYCSADESWFWRWLDRTPEIADEADTQTVNFTDEDRWTDETPGLIAAVMRDRRRVERHPTNAPVDIILDLTGYPAAQRPRFISAIRALVDETSVLTFNSADSRLVLTLTRSPATLRLAVGAMAYLEADTSSLSEDAIIALIRYMLAAAFDRLKLVQQADVMARACLAARQPCPNGELAADACRALTSSAMQSVELAILNELHETAFVPMLIFAHLHTAPFAPDDARNARERFLAAQLDAAQRADAPNSQGAVFYSLGNMYAAEGDVSRAFAAFNKARKLRPKYCETGYFLSEAAGALFGAGHFEMSARIYVLARERE
jgi:hypothetical protein